MTALSRSVRGSGSAAQRRLAAGSSAITLASSISAMGLPAAWASTCARARPRGGRGCPSSSRPASAADSGSRCSSREAPVKAGGRGLPPGAHQQHDPLGVQAAAGERQRVQRAAVQPVGVVGDHQDRGVFGQIRQQGQDGDPGQQRVGSTGVRGEAERPQQGLGLPAGQAGGAGQHRPQELMQPGEREFGLRFPAGDRQYPHARRPGPSGGVRQQHGLAHPRLTGDQQDLACLRDRIHQSAQPGQPGVPADDGCGLLRGEFTGAWHLPVLSASAFVNAVPKLNSDRGPGMPAARKVQSHHGYRSCLPGATVMTGPGVTTASIGTARIAMPFVTVGRENSAAIRIYYEDHGSGPPVVLVHGYALNGHSWEKQEAALLAAGHRVITYDRRGFGASSRPSTGYDFDTLAADLHVLLSRLDLRGVVLAGFAMGTGEVTRYLAVHGSGRVSAAVLVAPLLPFLLKTNDNPDGIDRSVFDGMTARIAADRPAAMKDFLDRSYNIDLLGGSRVSDQAWQNSFYVAISASAHAAISCVTACLEDFRGDLATISIPVLVIHGDQDRVLPYEATSRRLPALLNNARSIVIAGGPHAIIWTHADEVNQALLDFIGHPGRAGGWHSGPENPPQSRSQNGRSN